ncbi:MAG: methyltransferase type 11 [Rhodospirillaceae bacterium]|nr:methyltransferase type 11 [Rhodospirillaceae bacterium]
MKQEINLLEKYPKSKRPIDERAKMITEEHRAVARRFDRHFFDGDRLTGYGGFNYHPRFWTDTVAFIRDHYQLAADAEILDIGCAKGFMLHDFKQLMPDSSVRGIDVSAYAIENAKPEVKEFLQVADAKDLPFEDDSFDLVLAINTLHNLPLEECKQALREVMRVTRKHAFVMNDAWRNDDEKQAMLNWNLTALTYMHVDDWRALFDEVGYTGDYYWFIAKSD